jgi:ADP-ribose pyrophosphatase YjhB (NUDIX family)
MWKQRDLCSNGPCDHGAYGTPHRFTDDRTGKKENAKTRYPKADHCFTSFFIDRYTCVAGFVDVSESLEESVAREIYEELGLKVTSIRYITSHPWPTRRGTQIICGFFAKAKSDKIDVNKVTERGKDHGELEDARWFTLEQIKTKLEQQERDESRDTEDGEFFFRLSESHSMSNLLMKHWIKLREEEIKEQVKE